MARLFSKSRFAREDGQAAVLIAILCGVLIVAVAMVSNLGKVVTEKMAMQNAVDLAAYSGAATEAGYLNQMRLTNEGIWKALYLARVDFETSEIPGNPEFLDPDVQGCACIAAALSGPLTAPAAEAIRDAAKETIEGLEETEKAQDGIGYGMAIAATEQAATKNYPGTMVTFYNEESGDGMIKVKAHKDELTYRGWCVGIEPPVCDEPIVPSLFDTHDGETFDTWLYKDDKGSAAIAIGITNAHPVSPFMDLQGNYFTPTDCAFGTLSGGRCSLDVYAVAAPYFGKLGTIENGPATWEKEDGSHNNDQNEMVVDNPMLLSDAEPFGNHYKDYKARMVGIWESNFKLAGSGTPVNQAVPIGQNPLTAH